MDNQKKLATFGTQDTSREKQKTKTKNKNKTHTQHNRCWTLLYTNVKKTNFQHVKENRKCFFISKFLIEKTTISSILGHQLRR